MARREDREALRQPLLEFQPSAATARAVQKQERRARAVAEDVHGRAADGSLLSCRRHQPMKRPPFGDSHWPVTNDDSSEARNKAAAAISLGSPMRPIGVRPRIIFLASSGTPAVIGVSM